MKNIQILDCTLRDGGYINDWKFGFIPTEDIIFKLCDSLTDYVEVGFLRDCNYESDKVLFNNTRDIKKILPKNKGHTKFSVMALHNRYNIEKLEPYNGETIDIIRVTFHDYDIGEGLEFIKKAMAKGYSCFCNPINIMGYSDDGILKLINKANEIKPYGFSIVDTFGSMTKSDLVRIYHLVENNLDKSLVIGLHLHENLSLSFSLAQEFINMLAPGRSCVIDGSMMGMGRTPGNLPIELIMDYLNKNFKKDYRINPIYDAIDDYIMQYKAVESWGYSSAYAISAKYNLHRNYAEFLIKKDNLRAKDINNILVRIPNEKKTVYDQKYIQELYDLYLSIATNDIDAKMRFSEIIRDRILLVLAPGKSIKTHKQIIDAFIREKEPFVITANFTGDGLYNPDCCFISNIKRYEEAARRLPLDKIIITSNVTHSTRNTGMIFDYAGLAFYEQSGYFGNSVMMLLRLLQTLHTPRVYLAGFDGYGNDDGDYSNEYMESVYMEKESQNKMIKSHLSALIKQIDIRFLTPTLYTE